VIAARRAQTAFQRAPRAWDRDLRARRPSGSDALLVLALVVVAILVVLLLARILGL
jgi:hypothetical protein